MIDAKELRIGNWFNDVKGGGYNAPGFVKVRTIGSNGVNGWQDMGASGCARFEDIEPIPITPEILEQSGFVKMNECWIYINIMLNSFPKNHYKLNIHGFLNFNAIKYLHQLQNLYFALTNQELQVNLSATKSASLSL